MGLQSLGYEVAAAGTNQWNGVAIISRVGLEDVEVGFPGMPGFGDPVAAEARAIGATCGGVRLWSLYVPNGRKVGDPHYVYKLEWLAPAARGRRRLAGRGHRAGRRLEHRAARRGRLRHARSSRRRRTSRPPSGRPSRASSTTGTSTWCARTRPARRSTPTGTTSGSASSATAACASTSCSARPRWPSRVTGAFIDRDERAGTGASDHAPVVVDVA